MTAADIAPGASAAEMSGISKVFLPL